MKKRLLILSVLLLASLACNATNKLLTLEATSTPTPKILFQDDFSDPSSGWPKSTDVDGITDYDSGKYRIRVDTIGAENLGMDMWVHPGKKLDGDVRVEVDATKIGGPDHNDMGVLCKYSKTGESYRFYYFLITSDGYVGISKMKDGDSTMLSGTDMIQSSAVNQTSTNHIRADCIGKKLTLFVNGEQVASATDDEFTGGEFGLIAGTFDTPGVDIHFDNFVVTAP